MKKIGLLALVLLPVSAPVFAQAPRHPDPVVASMPAQAASAPSPQNVAILGDSAVTLAGPWKFAPGDSPVENGSPLWASPAFDDTAWASMDLHSEPGSTDAFYGSGGYLTGWSARGYPHLAGFAWYRLRVHLADPSAHLWLKMPNHTDDSYQIFANGHFIGEFGHFTPGNVVSYRSRPLTFALPAPDEHGDLLLAIRFYLEPSTLASGSTGDSGGMHQAPLLGLRSQVESTRVQEVTERILSVIVSVFIALFMLIAAAGAFRIWLLDRPSSTYLWLTLGLVLAAATVAVVLAAFFSYALTQDVANFLLDSATILSFSCWIVFWRKWFEIPRDRRMDIALLLLTTVAVSAQGFAQFRHSSPAESLMAFKIDAASTAALGAALFVSLLQGGRKDRVGVLVALPPIILLAISLFDALLLSWFHARTSIFPFGVQISIRDVAMFLLVVVVGSLVARRFLNSQVSQRLERQAVEQELNQARELQQHVLVPESVTSSHFTVETEYHPARTVGGDFFQVISRADDSLLIIVGDVSGKGIAAAMLVAVLVGAIRTLADESIDPGAILASLNQRLLGRSGGHFATCIVAEIHPDGRMRIANAGHLPPYLNGKELELDGSLPLGIVGEVEPCMQAFLLKAGDRLTFMTDGVVEATNTAKELFGFDRTRDISRQSAAAIAQQAQMFGQEDDITVLGVEYA